MKTRLLNCTASDCRAAFEPSGVIRRLFLSLLIVSVLDYAFLPEELRSLAKLDGIATLSFGRTVLLTLLLTFLLTAVALFLRTDHLERFCTVGVFAVFTFMAVKHSYTIYFYLFCIAILVLLAVDAFLHLKAEEKLCADVEPSAKEKADEKQEVGTIDLLFGNSKAMRLAALILVILFGATFVVGVITMTVSRVLAHASPTYDFGIFSQMYYYMKETGIPFTTCERDGLLSHFHVHVSPIYYLFLPFYALFPSPITLQVCQALMLAISLIPLYLLARKKGLSPLCTALICGALAFYPAFAGGTYYDLHENKFLTPCLLFLFYFTETKKPIGMAISALLVLSVKEDAPVYVAVYGLYLIVRTLVTLYKSDKRDKIFGFLSGGAMLVVSLVWFYAVTHYLATVGDGVMTYRYSNFMYDGGESLISVIKCVIMMPMKALYECADAEKFTFFLQTMLPLLFIPFMTRKHERLLLLIPYVLINLMSDYQYQHDIFFQYTYGATAFLFYLAVLNLADMKRPEPRRALALVSLFAAISLFVPTVGAKIEYYKENYEANKAVHSEIDELLETIPEEASVTTTTWYTVPLSRRRILYDLYYGSDAHIFSTDYVILQPNDSYINRKFGTDEKKTNGLANLKKKLAEYGYVLVDEIEGRVLVYQKTQNP
ncbi:MAG: DUF2079 domain-containing protein [Clostridia bacterium]|nr:DUF2079 domain-containing protein [Clostridia bacterium]